MSTTATPTIAPPPAAPVARPPAALLAAAVALALAHLPLLVAHGFVLWGRPHYQFFPIVLAGAALLAWPAIKARVSDTVPTPGIETWAMLGLNWLMLTAALILDSPWLGAVAFLVLLVALAHAYGGWRLVRGVTPALVYLLLIIPPPFGWDTRLVNFLQTLTSKCGNYVLDYIGVLHQTSGNVIEIAGKKYFVEEACSGINSLLSVLACTLFYVFWAKTHWLRGILLIVAAVSWVLVANVTRVVVIVFFDVRFGWDLLQEPWHSILGFILFGLVLLLLVSTDRFLMFLGTSIRWGTTVPTSLATPTTEPAGPPARRGWSYAVPVAAAYAVLVLLQAVGYAAGIGQFTRPVFDPRVVEVCNAFDQDALPLTIGTWKRDPKTGYTARDKPEMYYADHSRTWVYTRGPAAVTLSFDYPYPEWHDLEICYKGTGWTIGETTDFRHSLPEQGSELACIMFTMSRPPTRHARVWYCSFDERGGPAERLSVTEFRWGERFNALKSGLGKLGGSGRSVRPQILQVQALTESFVPMSDQLEKDVDQFFRTAAGMIRQKFVAGVATP